MAATHFTVAADFTVVADSMAEAVFTEGAFTAADAGKQVSRTRA
jgi:hypothetical protein